ncbi:MAG: hypothetical protein B6D41_01115 [Chloroflexi bacterium UTCFX4]|jgi:hypothetical protein|nr:MAG: hypothetical protein B6D41_01115 [Chloroflexi bacterium UTCFX4]
MSKNSPNFFSLRQAEKLMGRRYQVVCRFGPMLPQDEGRIVNLKPTPNGYALVFAARQRGDASQYKTALLSPREMLCLREIELNAPVDLLIACGEKFWHTPEDMIREINVMGFSHRLPSNFDARRVRKGASRVFLGHQKAIMRIGKGTLEELLAYLNSVNDRLVTRILQRTHTHPPSRFLELPSPLRERVFRKFHVTFEYGIFGFVYASAATYYLKPNEKETPAQVTQRGYVGVRAKRIQEKTVIDNGEMILNPITDEVAE